MGKSLAAKSPLLSHGTHCASFVVCMCPSASQTDTSKSNGNKTQLMICEHHKWLSLFFFKICGRGGPLAPQHTPSSSHSKAEGA